MIRCFPAPDIQSVSLLNFSRVCDVFESGHCVVLKVMSHTHMTFVCVCLCRVTSPRTVSFTSSQGKSSTRDQRSRTNRECQLASRPPRSCSSEYRQPGEPVTASARPTVSPALLAGCLSVRRRRRDKRRLQHMPCVTMHLQTALRL